MFDEAEKTVLKNKDGKYIDLTKLRSDSITKEDLEFIKNYVRPRFMITPNCNLWCTFCSNEGSGYDTKSNKPMSVNNILKLSKMFIEDLGSKSIDFSGGEPLIHPDFQTGKFEIAKFTKKYPDVHFAIHTNGVELTPSIIKKIKESNISRIGISLHSFNFENWNKITNKNCVYDSNIQKMKFSKIMNNLKYLSKSGLSDRVMLKSIVVRDINSSKKEVLNFLENVSRLGFHPRFIQYEAMHKEDVKNIVPRSEFFQTLEELGCAFSKDTPRGDNTEKEYIPLVNFNYGEYEKKGLHGIIKCGTSGACKSCYKYLVAFIKPTPDGESAYLKPCSVLDTRLDLQLILKNNDAPGLLKIFNLSREYLYYMPGLGTEDWNK